MGKTIIIGAGAFARDLIDAFGADSFAGIYVDPQYASRPLVGLPLLTDWTEVRKIASYYALGISDIAHRERARRDARQAGLEPTPPFVSRAAIVAADAKLGPGCLIGHMTVIGPGADLHEDVLVMHAVVVGHDSVIGANCVICAGVALGGYVQLGSQAFVGSNAVISPGVKIGAGSYIAAGAACFKDAEPRSRLIGNPARRSPAT